MKLSIVLSTHAAKFQAVAYKGDFEQNVVKIASYGFDGVEPAVRDPSLVDHDSLVATVSKHALAIPAIGTGQAWGEERLSFTDPDPKVRQQAVDRIASHVPLAKKAGAVIIIGLVRGIIQEGVREKQAREWMFSSFKTCVEIAGKAGVRIAFEPLNRYETPLLNTAKESLELIERVGADNLGLLLDTFHMNIEEPSIEQSIKICAERIFHFHVADSNRWYPGAGHLDFRRILETLFSTGYAGFVSGEFMAVPDADVAAQKGIQHLRGLGL
ncbi:MAG: sugar phosphate isomerase/epimerase [Spirochaetaceae bacterium]|nr:MAG: sugar phosphate isomerase/epimerase [Spirochaetaceae bacterium]